MYGPQYGQLSPWVADLAHRSDIIGFPRARLILEAQACLMQFLRRVVEQILQGINLETRVFYEVARDDKTGLYKNGRRCVLVVVYIPALFCASNF